MNRVGVQGWIKQKQVRCARHSSLNRAHHRLANCHNHPHPSTLDLPSPLLLDQHSFCPQKRRKREASYCPPPPQTLRVHRQPIPAQRPLPFPAALRFAIMGPRRPPRKPDIAGRRPRRCSRITRRFTSIMNTLCSALCRWTHHDHSAFPIVYHASNNA